MLIRMFTSSTFYLIGLFGEDSLCFLPLRFREVNKKVVSNETSECEEQHDSYHYPPSNCSFMNIIIWFGINRSGGGL